MEPLGGVAVAAHPSMEKVSRTCFRHTICAARAARVDLTPRDSPGRMEAPAARGVRAVPAGGARGAGRGARGAGRGARTATGGKRAKMPRLIAKATSDSASAAISAPAGPGPLQALVLRAGRGQRALAAAVFRHAEDRAASQPTCGLSAVELNVVLGRKADQHGPAESRCI